MSEQIKSNEVILERFKESMLEVIHEQSNLFFNQIKSVMPTQSATPTQGITMKESSNQASRISAPSLKNNHSVIEPSSRAKETSSQFTEPSIPTLMKKSSTFQPSNLAVDSKQSAASLRKESGAAMESSFLKPPTGEKKVRPVKIDVMIPPKPTPDV